MAELHKNQVAWSAPEPIQVSLAKKQDFIGPALQQLGQQASALADTQKAIEDAKIEADMKQAQEQALFDLQNSKRLNPKEYVKDQQAALAKMNAKLGEYSEDVKNRFLRDNPQYFEAFELSTEKIVLDKQTQQAYQELKLSIPMLAEEALRYGSFDYGYKKVQEAAANLTAEQANDLLFAYREYYDEGAVYAAAYTKDYGAVKAIVEDKNKLQGWGPARKTQFLYSVQKMIDSDMKELMESFNQTKKATAENAYGYVTNYLLTLQKYDEKNYPRIKQHFVDTGQLIHINEDGTEETVDFLDTLTWDGVSKVRADVDKEEPSSSAYINGRNKFLSDLAATDAAVAGSEAEDSKDAIPNKLRLKSLIFSDDATVYLSSEELQKRRTNYYKEYGAFQESWGPIGANKAITRGSPGTWFDRLPWSTKQLSSLGSYQKGLQPVNAEAKAAEMGALSASVYTGSANAATARTASQRFKELYKKTRNVEIKFGSRGEAVVHMLAGLVQNPEYRKELGIPDYVNDNVLNEAAVDYLDLMAIDDTLNKTNTLETATEDFNGLFAMMAGSANKQDDAVVQGKQKAFVVASYRTATGAPEGAMGGTLSNFLFEPYPRKEEVKNYLGDLVIEQQDEAAVKYQKDIGKNWIERNAPEWIIGKD